ncbi:MAG: amidase, partial [Spirochaetales bacterium]
MTFAEFRQYDGIGLAELVARGEVTATELLECAIDRAQTVNPVLNGIVIPLYEKAREQAARFDSRPGGLRAEKPPDADAPFRGVPMLVKDLFQEIGGAPHYMGNVALKAADHRAGSDSELVRRFRSAGAVIFGRTNTPEFGLKGITEPASFGPTRNPWKLQRSPGGSSGGSAAMVAAGVVPFAGANDGGGSIRIPASNCGLFGFKPGRGRTPWGPGVPEATHGMAVNHVLTRSVRDSAAMLDSIGGPEPGSPIPVAPPARPYREEVGRDPGRLRIAYSTRSPIHTPVHHTAVNAVTGAVSLLRSLGHEVEEAEPGFDGEALARDWLLLWFVTAAATVDMVRTITGCSARRFETDTRLMAALGRSLNAVDYFAAYERKLAYNRAFDAFLSGGPYDLWLTPVTAEPPPFIGTTVTPRLQAIGGQLLVSARAGSIMLKSGALSSIARSNMKLTPFTQVANMTGGPSIS